MASPRIPASHMRISARLRVTACLTCRNAWKKLVATAGGTPLRGKVPGPRSGSRSNHERDNPNDSESDEPQRRDERRERKKRKKYHGFHGWHGWKQEEACHSYMRQALFKEIRYK